MSRTWREIPHYGSKLKKIYYEDGGYSWTVEEESFHEYSFTKKVRDKDNHGCTYSKPKEFTQNLNRRMRVNEKQKLNTLVNTSYTVDDYEEHFENLIHEHPQEYKEWYW